MAEGVQHPLVGFARHPLPVPPGTPLGGYMDRTGPAIGTLDPLEVSVVTVTHAGRTAAICVADVPVVNRDVAGATRERVAAAVGTSPELVWLTATHTHAGPDTGCWPRGDATPQPWNELIPDAAAGAAEQAVARASAAELTLHRGHLMHVGGQRAGARKGRTVPASTLCARAPETGEPVGVLAVLAVHATVLDATNRLVSADLNGAVRRALPPLLARRDAWCAVATGAAGDISTRPYRRASTGAELERLGAIAAEQLRDILDRPPARRFDGRRRLAGRRSVVRLRGRPVLTAIEQESVLARARARHDDARRNGDAVAVREAATAVQGAELSIAAARDGGDIDCAADVLDLAGLLLVGVGGEPYSELGELAGATDGAVLVGYANGYCGYLPTRPAYEREDYEVLISPVAPGEGERAVEHALGLLGGPAVEPA